MSGKYSGENVGNYRTFPLKKVHLSSLEWELMPRLNDVTVHGTFDIQTKKVKCSFHFPRAIPRVIDIVDFPGYCIPAVSRRVLFDKLPVCYFQISEEDGSVHHNVMAYNLCKSFSVSEIVEFCNGGASLIYPPCDNGSILTNFFEFPLLKSEYMERCIQILRRFYLYFDIGAITHVTCEEKKIEIRTITDTVTPIGNINTLELNIDSRGYMRHGSISVGYVGDFSLATVEEEEVFDVETGAQLEKERNRIFAEVKGRFATIESLDEMDGILHLLIQQMMKLR